MKPNKILHVFARSGVLFKQAGIKVVL